MDSFLFRAGVYGIFIVFGFDRPAPTLRHPSTGSGQVLRERCRVLVYFMEDSATGAFLLSPFRERDRNAGRQECLPHLHTGFLRACAQVQGSGAFPGWFRDGGFPMSPFREKDSDVGRQECPPAYAAYCAAGRPHLHIGFLRA